MWRRSGAEDLKYVELDGPETAPAEEFQFALVTLLVVLTLFVASIGVADEANLAGDSASTASHFAMLQELHESTVYDELRGSGVQSYQASDTACDGAPLIQRDAYSDGGYFYYENPLPRHGELCEFGTGSQAVLGGMVTFDRPQFSSY